jgi:hypothetical protein
VLSEAESRQIESTLLPALERHHLRLLAHSLRTLQAVADRRGGAAPTRAAIEAWARSQPQVGADVGFAEAFVDQLIRAAHQLEAIATEPVPETGQTPTADGALGLDLDDLVAWARRQADQRIAANTPQA